MSREAVLRDLREAVSSLVSLAGGLEFRDARYLDDDIESLISTIQAELTRLYAIEDAGHDPWSKADGHNWAFCDHPTCVMVRGYETKLDRARAIEDAAVGWRRGRCDTCFYTREIAGDEWCEGWSKTDCKTLYPECWMDGYDATVNSQAEEER